MPPKRKVGGPSAVKKREEPHGFEFGGPLGAVGMTVGLPILCYLFAFACNDISGCPAPSLLTGHVNLEAIKQDIGWPGFEGLFSLEATAWVLAYYLLLVVLFVAIPAPEVEGVEMRTGGKLTYKLNGRYSSSLAISVLNC